MDFSDNPPSVGDPLHLMDELFPEAMLSEVLNEPEKSSVQLLQTQSETWNPQDPVYQELTPLSETYLQLALPSSAENGHLPASGCQEFQSWLGIQESQPPVQIEPTLEDSTTTATETFSSVNISTMPRKNQRRGRPKKEPVTKTENQATPGTSRVGRKESGNKNPPKKAKTQKQMKANQERITREAAKKQKLHELDDPRAKNAKAAFRNRERKKKLMATQGETIKKLEAKLQQTESALAEKSLNEVKLQQELSKSRQGNRATTGLNENLPAASVFLQLIMPALQQYGDGWRFTAPQWFDLASKTSSECTGESIHERQNTGLSKFFTYHVNTHDKIVVMDYNPDSPLESLSSFPPQ